MKINYLLIIDFFLIVSRIFVSRGQNYFDILLTRMNFKANGNRWMKTEKRLVFPLQYSATVILSLFFLLGSFSGFSQVGKAFSPRLSGGNIKVKGDVMMIGNTILTPKNQALPYNGGGNNNDLDAVYLDIDGDASTVSSSSADLAINNSCKKIVFAGLYWSAMYPTESSSYDDRNCFNCGPAARDDWNVVQFKVPGATTYTTITADKADPKEVIFKGNSAANPFVFNDGVYVCFKDVTSLLAAPSLANADGTYTVANLRATTGRRRGGSAGGWTLVVIYESPTLPSKFISVFDGAQMTNVDSGTNQLLEVNIPIIGFQTLPAPLPVNAKMGVAALDGDYNFKGDGLSFREGVPPPATPATPANSFFTSINNTLNPSDNFFNATITNNNVHVTNRNPTNRNNLGFDIDQMEIPNALTSVIHNNATQGTLRLNTNNDGYAAFVVTFAVDIIEPKILLTKEVFDIPAPTTPPTPPKNMGDQDVTLGQQLSYVIGFQNQGNDHATAFTITDQLPINTVFVYPNDIDVASLPTGVTHSYDATTRTITFTIPNNLVEINDPRYEIRFKVKVVDSCNQLSDACSNVIQNIALSDYSGTFNKGKFGDKSLSSYTTCNIGIPQSTNFLVGIDDCKFTKSEVLCGSSVVLTASNGYNSYKWSTAPFTNTGTTTGTILGNSQTLTVTNPGTYYVYNTAIAPCLSITEEVTVTRFGGVIANPVIPFADQTLTCPNDGKKLPLLFLCGADASKLIKTNISDGSTIVWEKLDEASCTAVTNSSCANEGTTCTWTQVATGSDYSANTSGQFRLTLNYPGGCFNRFYFNVYQNLLDPTETHRDIVCTKLGNITIGGVGSGYEYSINGTNYQSSNSFTINTAGLYTAYIRQVGIATNPCIFTIPNIQIRKRNFTIDTFVTQPLCFGEKGSIKVAANDVLPQYSYFVYDGGTLVNSVGPINDADYTFENLTPGKTYQVQVTTPDGCDKSEWITINQPAAALTATAALVEPLTACSDGKIVVTAQGGNWAPYYYFVNGSTTFQTSNEIIVTAPGKYDILVVDSKNCSTTTSITVADNAKPTYTVSNTNSNCYDDNAQISVNVTNANGYSLSYSINNGGSFQTNPVFSNLTSGDYNVVVRYGITYTPQWGSPTIKYCTDPAQIVTVTGPTSAVTASAGVAELAGCGRAPFPTSYGKVRITNPQGGTPFPAPDPYLYSFDNQATWVTTNEAYLAPGTYTLYIKDASGCIFSMPNITIDPEPIAPTIDVASPVFNCDGTANSTVTITNSGSANFEYGYLLNGIANTNLPPNVFVNVPSGSHTVSVTYKLLTVPTYSNLLKEDFGRGGDTTSPGINSAYCWEKQDGVVECNRTPADWHPWLMNDGDYVVTQALLPSHANDFQWTLPKDHTAVLNNTPSITDGRFLAVNIGKTIPAGAVLYSKTINDVVPGQDINVSLYMLNLLKTTNNLPSPQLTIQLSKGGIVIASEVMPSIPRDEKWHSSTDLAGGTIFKLNPGPNTSLEFQIISNSTIVDGNDLAIDDIHVYQLPKSCVTQVDFPFIVPTGKAFDASITGFKNVSCSGANDGTITIAVQNFNPTNGFQYSINNGTTWNTQLTSPYTITSLAAANYTILIRYDATSTGTCLKTFSQIITAPTPVTVTASATTLATCSTGATITAIGAGGTLAYQYELRDAAGVVVIRPYQLNAQFTNIPVGNYTVFVKDANGCISAAGAVLNVVAPPTLTAMLDAGSDICFDSVNQASLIVNVSGGTPPFTYSLNGAAAQNSNSFINVGTGTHNIVVTDSNNCTATISNIDIKTPLTIAATLAQDLTCLASASITSTVSGGYGAPYTYAVTRDGAALPVPTFPYAASVAGTYVFTATDSKGCPASSNPIIVSPKTTPTLTFIKTDITCNNVNDGTITVTPANGFTTTYTYAIKPSSATTYSTQATNQFTGLAAGIYDIKVIDSKGCESLVSNVTILNPGVVTGTISATDIQCSATGTVPAVVTVTAGGGTGSYQYSFNSTTNFTSSNTYSTSAAGIVNAYIRDANGCQIGPLPVTIAAFDQISLITITDSGYDCATSPPGGHVNIAATGVSAPIRFQIISGPPGYDASTNSDGEFKSLPPGNYVFQATDTKTKCSLTKPYTVNGAPDIVAGGSVLSPIKCFGGTGTIQFTVNGVKEKYDYIIKNAIGTTIQSASNLSPTLNAVTIINVPAAQPAGVYTITVTDRKTKCTDDYTVTLNQPAAALAIATAVATSVNCNNDNSQITVTATGGTPNYTYAALPAGSTATPVYLPNPVITVDTNSSTVLSWDVYVKDANDCTTKTTTPVVVVSDPTPSVTAVISNQCAGTGSNFTITATGTGGTGALTYGINGVNGAFQSSPTFTVASGTYIVWVKDANGCPASATPTTVYPQLTALAQVTKTLDCNTAGPNATITTTITGGNAPYSYVITNSGGTQVASGIGEAGPTFSYTGVAADTYTVTVTDANTPGCTATSIVTVNPITPPSVTATPTQVTCHGGSNGSVQLAGAGGSGGYTYSDDNVNFVPTSLFSGLAASATPYTFYVKDSKGCIGTITAPITEPPVLTATTALGAALSCGTGNAPQAATITVTAPSGGNGPYEYSYNGGAYTANTSYTTSASGDVTISMRDGNNCIVALTNVVVNTLNPPVISGIGASIITCKTGETTSTATITTTGGTGTPVYTIVSGPTINITGAGNGVFTGLTAGTYVFKVTDSNGCSDTEMYNIPARVDINATLQSQVNVLCFGNSTGSAKINVTNFSTYTAGLTTGSGLIGITGNTVDVTGLVAGPYVLRITDGNTSCFKDVFFTITQNSDLVLASSTNINANCITPTSTVTVAANGGKAPYQYAFVADGASPPVPGDYTASNIGNLDPATANWDVYVLDANNCSKKILDVVVAKDGLPTIAMPAAQCFTGSPFTITLVGSGGIGSLTYTVNGASIVGNTYTVTAAGTYVLGVKDANNCPATVSYIVDKPIKAGAALGKDITCSVPVAATINVTITDGFAPFTYQILDGGIPVGAPKTSATPSFQETFATAGNYSFEITDSKLCSITTNVIAVTDPVPVVLNPIALNKPILCNGESTAEITVTYDNTQGTGPFVINVKQYLEIAHSTLVKDFGPQTSGLPAGFYVVTLTDAKGCFKTEDITITEPKKIDVAYTPTNITCNLGGSGQTKGRIEVTSIIDGTGPYDIYVTNNSGYIGTRTDVDGTTNEVFDIIDFGLYQVLVVDANGCSWIEKDILIAQPPGGLDLDISALPPPCGSLGSAEVKIATAFTSAGPFYFAIYTPGITYSALDPRWLPEDGGVGSKKATFPGLIPGVTYTFIVYDSGTNCYYYETFTNTVPSNSSLTATGIGNPIVCNGGANGSVDLNIVSTYGANVAVSYEIFDSSTLVTTGISGTGTVNANGNLTIDNFGFAPGLAYGSYYVLITETSGPNTGCAITTAPFSITQSAIDLILTASSPKNDNTCTTDAGIITAIAKNGTGPYEYAIVADGATAPTVFAASNTFNKDAGAYDVYVKDAYGCIKQADVTVLLDTAPTIVAPAAVVCYTGSPIAVTITGNTGSIVGPVTYSVDNGAVLGAYQSSANFSLTPGSYTLNLKDGNGCVASTPYEIKDQLTITPSLTKELDCTTAGSNATVTVTAAGGNTASYTYTITAGTTSNVTGVTSGVFTDLDAGNYTFQVSDGVCTATNTITIDALVPIVPAVAPTNPLCVGASGEVVVTATGGTGIYQYKKGLTGTYSPINVFSQTAAEGAVDYYVRDSKNCEQTIPATLTDPAPIVISNIAVDPLTCGAGNSAQEATITVTAAGGTGALEYSFDNGANYSSDPIYKTTIAGGYDIIVRDANNCISVMQTATVALLVPPTLAPTMSVIDCTNTTSTVDLNVAGGVAPFTYSVEYNSNGTAIAPQTNDDVFLSLAAGDYLFRVTDGNGCIDEKWVSIPPVIPIQLQEEVTANVNCFGDVTGSAKFIVTGFSTSGNYTVAIATTPPSLPFTLNPVVGDVITLSGLSQGTYTVTVQDNTTHCDMTKSVTITQPGAVLDITASASNVNCNNSSSIITVNPTGGKPIYQYAFLEAGSTATPVFSNNTNVDTAVLTNAVTAGAVTTWDVDVYVKDSNGCTDFTTVTITKDISPSIVAPSSQCFVGTPFTIDLSAVTTVPVGPVQYYTINGSNYTNPIYTIVAPGTYHLSVVDANGCSSNVVDYIVQPQLTLQADMTQDLTCAVNASITLIPAGGTTTYVSYEVMINGLLPYSTLPAPVSPYVYTTNTAGTYKFRVTDTQGCQAESQDVIVTPNTTPTATPAPTNVSCIGTADGTITLTPSGGIIPYQYSINGGAYQSSNVFTGLAFGNYSIVVKDAKECTSVVIPVSITEPTAVTASATVTPFGCNTANAPQDAIVTIISGGGTPGYTYSFDGGSTFQISAWFTVNSAQTINYVVRDANGCSVSGSADVLPYTPPTDMDITATPIYCSTTPAEATVTVNSVTGGVGPYVFQIIAPGTAATAPSVPVNTIGFANLAPDTYTIQVTDANGCSTTKPIVVEEADKISVTAQLINDVYCNGDSSGVIEFTVANYITAGSYTYGLVPAPVVPPTVNGDVIRYTNLPAGTYTFTVTDNVSGCIDDVVDFAVSQLPAIDFTATATNINCSNDNATITVAATGGTGTYKYAVVSASALAPALTDYVLSNQLTVDTNNGTVMNWVVYVMDTNGCPRNKPQTILLDANPTISSATATQCPSATGTYDITVTATGFSAALQYSVDGSFQNSNILTVNAPGSYNVVVKDANGCPSATYPVTILEPLTLTASITTIPNCNDADGAVTLTATGGTIPSTYEYSRDGSTYGANNVFTGLAPNVLPYTFYVRDLGTGCVKSIDFTIEPATIVTDFALSKTDVSCNGGSDGTITSTMSIPAVGVNDNPVYMYSLNGGTPQSSNLFTGLTAGNYTVDVISGRGCRATASIPVDEPANITVPAPVVAPFGCTSGNVRNLATISVTGVTGGSNTYLNYEFIKVGTPNTRVQFSSSTVYTEADLGGGSYIVNVFDSNGCRGTTTAPITIAPYIALDHVDVVVNPAITCNNPETITATAVDASGTAIAGIQYAMVDVSGTLVFAPNATGIFTGLTVGNYIITATNPATGCSIQEVHYVSKPNTFDLVVDNIVDVTCFGGTNGSANGSANVTIVDSSTPSRAGAFTYTLVDSLGNSLPGGSSATVATTLSGLGAGVYTITATLTNTPFCTVAKNFTITGPTAGLNGTATHTEITCAAGNNDGTISATASGGWPGGYEYELVGPVNVAYTTNPEFTGLIAGSYTVNVRDSKGCVDSTPVILSNPVPIVINATANTAILSCYGDTTGVITVNTTTGGQGSNYLYTLNTMSATPIITSGPQTSNVFAGLAAGTYSVSVTDGWGCSATTSSTITIAEPTIVEASLVLTTSQTCLTQSTLTLAATGGTAPYTYSADGITYNPATFNSSVAISVPVGTYRYYVRDANGCKGYVSNDVKIEPLPTLTVSLDYVTTSVNCTGETTGVIVAVANGGLGNYVYTLLDGATNLPVAGAVQATPGNFTQLGAGTYKVGVVSGDCNATSATVTITQPLLPLIASPIPINATCNGANNGTIIINASGGTGIIKYAISPRLDQFFTSNVFENLAPGSYEIIVQDQNGCYIHETGIVIDEPTPIVASVIASSIMPEMCFGDKDGAFTLDIIGGTLPYSVSLDKINGPFTPGTATQTQFDFTGLAGGNHTVYIRDANLCNTEIMVPLPESVKLDPKAIVDYGCLNNSPSLTVTVTLDASITNPADVDYALDGVPYAATNVFQLSNVFENVAPGIHQITARHSNGCEVNTLDFEILQIDPLTLVLSDGGLNEIVATVTGGAGGYQYTLNGEPMGGQSKFIYYKSGEYTVTVTDANGCVATATRYYEFIDIKIPNVFTPNGDGDNDGWTPTNTMNYPDLVFHIFDRYGRKVGTYREGQFWDGKYNGKELPTGDYWYVLKLRNEQDSREFVGHFTLYR